MPNIRIELRLKHKPWLTCDRLDRFEKSVVVDRMRSAQDLLNFAGQRHYLVACKAFKEFFEVMIFSGLVKAGFVVRYFLVFLLKE